MGVRGGAREPGTVGRRVEVRIGELVLDGFPAGDGYRIAEVVKRELARVIGEQGLAGSQRKTSVLDGGSFPVEAGTSGATIGRRVAQSVYRGLAGGRGK